MSKISKILLLSLGILLSISNQIFGQSLSSLLKNFYTSGIKIDSIQRYFKAQQEILVNFTRKIDNGHLQLLIDYHPGGDISYEIFIQAADSLPYIMVVNKKSYTGYKRFTTNNEVFLFNEEKEKEISKIQDSIYDSKTSISDFKNFELNMYGRGCGYLGSPTQLFTKMVTVCTKNNPSLFDEWLQNSDYETKAMGATGLLILQQKGMKLTDYEVKIIAHLKKLNTLINYCAGCTDFEPKTTSYLLDKKLIRNYKNF